jgi:mannose-6-phosphate isomerase-like protein (cupin superfamily)
MLLRLLRGAGRSCDLEEAARAKRDLRWTIKPRADRSSSTKRTRRATAGTIRSRGGFAGGRFSPRAETLTDGITCGVADLGPGDWLGLHRHAPPEIYYVFEGAGVVTLNGEDVPVKAGSAVFIPGMAEHGVRQSGTGLLRFFYGFPVDSFDSVEYLFSRASPA